jgi:hypothetical protein
MSNKSKFLKSLVATLFVTVSCSKPLNTAPVYQNTAPAIVEQDLGPISAEDVILDTSDKAEAKRDDSFLKLENTTVKHSIEETYAPELYFDSLEDAYMTSVPRFLDTGIKLEANRALWKNPRLKERVTASELATYTTSKVKIKGLNLTLMLQTDNKVTPYDPVVYTHKFQIGEYTNLQYWFFYSYNDTKGIGGNKIIHKCGNHQGDWEHVALRIKTANYTSAKTEEDFLRAIDGVYFSQHNSGQNDERKFKKVGDTDLHMDGTHIKGYVARGTHATYSEPSGGKGYLLASVAGIKLYDKADGKGTSLKSINNLVDFNSQPWSKYGGRWGEISNDICSIAELVSDSSNDGPTSPYYRDNYAKSDW